MTRFFKTIFIVFFFLNLCVSRQTAFAWQSPYSPAQDSLYGSDDNIDTAAVSDDEWTETTVEDAPVVVDENYNYNEAHFYEATNPPATVKRDISDAEWNKLTKDPAFNYEDEKEELKPQKEYKPGWWEHMFESIFSFLTSSAGKMIIIILVVLIVLALVFRIFQLNGNILFSKKDKSLAQEDIDPEHHVPDDWEKEINTAALAGNYRLALRYSYRYLLMMLQEKGKINFQVAKTNYQYVYELKGSDLHKPVMQLTREYEYAWYGGFNIEKPFFENYQQMIATIKRELNY